MHIYSRYSEKNKLDKKLIRMASTALKTEEEKKEFFDPPEVLDEKTTLLAKWIKESKHFIAFTGAGISTSAGIPDFRSGINTVLPTGPGAWEKLATKTKDTKKIIRSSMASAVPTITHMSFVKLMNEGYLKFLISQNTDGLHRKSGIPRSKLAEVHGNTNLEKCKKCGKEYMRDYRTRTAKDVHDHKTGRKCTVQGCTGELYDSIINFGENLPERELKEGFDNGKIADVCLAMGSSLRVTPAADMPETVAEKGGKLVIVNLQATPLDSVAALVIHGMCDDVMARVMKKLELNVDPFALKRYIRISKTSEKGKNAIKVYGIDSEGTPYSLFSKVEFKIAGKVYEYKKEPFIGVPPPGVDLKEVNVTLYFQGHYGEPPATLLVPMADGKEKTFTMSFTPGNKEKKGWDNIVNVTK